MVLIILDRHHVVPITVWVLVSVVAVAATVAVAIALAVVASEVVDVIVESALLVFFLGFNVDISSIPGRL